MGRYEGSWACDCRSVGKSRHQRTVWIDPSDDAQTLHFGETTRSLRDFGYALHESELAGIAASDLRHALVQAEPYDQTVLVFPSMDWIDEDVIASSGVEFGLADGELIMDVDVGMDYIDDDDQLRSVVAQLLGDLLVRHRAELVSVEHNGSYIGEPPHPTLITIRPAIRGRTLDKLFGMGVDVAALVDAAAGGTLTRRPTLDMLRAGHGAVLIGQPESVWLDVKKHLYDLSHLNGKVSLAQAVARFANSEGGIVVFGMDTRRVGSGEVISQVRPVPTDGHTVRRHRQVLEQHLYPLPVGLDVEIVPVTGGQLLVVHVPPQPDEVKPFLVHGAIVDSKGEGSFISIVRRHGEDTIPITAPAVHAAMSMNRIIDRLRTVEQGSVGRHKHDQREGPQQEDRDEQ